MNASASKIENGNEGERQRTKSPSMIANIDNNEEASSVMYNNKIVPSAFQSLSEAVNQEAGLGNIQQFQTAQKSKPSHHDLTPSQQLQNSINMSQSSKCEEQRNKIENLQIADNKKHHLKKKDPLLHEHEVSEKMYNEFLDCNSFMYQIQQKENTESISSDGELNEFKSFDLLAMDDDHFIEEEYERLIAEKYRDDPEALRKLMSRRT
jgi:hypothetical protein